MKELLRWLGHPFRSIARGLGVLVNLSQTQIRAVFSLGMLGGIVALSWQNFIYAMLAKNAMDATGRALPWFGMILEQMRYNSALAGWFAVILGLVVYGADYLKAKWGDRELGLGRGRDAEPGE